VPSIFAEKSYQPAPDHPVCLGQFGRLLQDLIEVSSDLNTKAWQTVQHAPVGHHVGSGTFGARDRLWCAQHKGGVL
jgi:hypothetical protein